MEMKTVLIREYGSNDVVEIIEVSRPEPAAGEVLVKVHAAGVNPIDWKIRGGAGERMGMTLPIRLGSEVVGTIETCGAGVSQFQKGDAVLYGAIWRIFAIRCHQRRSSGSQTEKLELR